MKFDSLIEPLRYPSKICHEMARKTKAKALLDRQKAEESPQTSKKGDGKDKALKVKGTFARCDYYVQPHYIPKSTIFRWPCGKEGQQEL